MKEIVLAAAGYKQQLAGFSIAAKKPVVVYGTMDGNILAGLMNSSQIPVYLYETG
ncbi:hypothetical protein [Desulfolucanica intricata]|uniref:hypothetical protein n=1 Tax=Desulfolucanica intricata TaxID=1285191 RepID=UPI000A67DC27|nr:hypothetical protein [Desulfolucanica intricata]